MGGGPTVVHGGLGRSKVVRRPGPFYGVLAEAGARGGRSGHTAATCHGGHQTIRGPLRDVIAGRSVCLVHGVRGLTADILAHPLMSPPTSPPARQCNAVTAQAFVNCERRYVGCDDMDCCYVWYEGVEMLPIIALICVQDHGLARPDVI